MHPEEIVPFLKKSVSWKWSTCLHMEDGAPLRYSKVPHRSSAAARAAGRKVGSNRMDQGYATVPTSEAEAAAKAAAAAKSVSAAEEGYHDAVAGAVAAAERVRPLRRDAERNRLLILSAAKTVFAQRGLEASLDEIAREAGLGVGTVYRRFPNRDALIDALFADGLSSIERIVEAAMAMPRAWDGLTHFMAGMLESQATDKGLRDVMLSRHTPSSHDEDFTTMRIKPALYEIVHRAQEEGDLRRDLTPTDVGVLEVALVGIVEFTASVGPDVWRRYLSIILDGIRARPEGANAPLDHPPLDDYQVDDCMAVWKYGSRETPRQRPKPN